MLDLACFLDRLWRRIESVPLFRIQLGYFDALNMGKGISLTIQNVGLDPVPEYAVWLYHPDRGSLGVFDGDYKKVVFPQYPQQENQFRCVTKPDPGTQYEQDHLRCWLHQVRGGEVAAPHFAGFRLRLVLRNSDQVLFEDEGLGNNIASHIYRDVMGKSTEQPVENVFYRSKAPFLGGVGSPLSN